MPRLSTKTSCKADQNGIIVTNKHRTNNGLMHVIDKVMSPLDIEDTASISSTAGSGPLTTRTNAPLGTASASATVTVTASSSGIAAPMGAVQSSWIWMAVAVIGGIIG